MKVKKLMDVTTPLTVVHIVDDRGKLIYQGRYSDMPCYLYNVKIKFVKSIYSDLIQIAV